MRPLRVRLLPILVSLAALVAMSALAVTPAERLADPALEARARELSQGLRCLVCQNQSIDDSNAALAHDLRVLVRERLTAGDSNDEVLSYVVARYGDYVLMRPPLRWSTLALWAGPGVLLLVGGWLAVGYVRGRRDPSGAAVAPEPLTETEKQQLQALLGPQDR
jgi:cytochrome c-type biogenesis protein CcmH